MYSKQKLNQQIIRLNIEGHLQRILQSETVDQLISTELHSLVVSPEGQLLSSAGIKLSSLRPLVKPYVVELLTDVVPVIMERFTSYAQVGRSITVALLFLFHQLFSNVYWDCCSIFPVLVSTVPDFAC